MVSDHEVAMCDAVVSQSRQARIAVVHDWLLGMRGGEYCLKVLCDIFPQAEIFTLFYDPEAICDTIKQRRVTASCFNRLPLLKRYYRWLLPIYPMLARDLSEKLNEAHKINPYDLVVSISHCAAKNVVVPKGVGHLCYCLTPMRYIWDQYGAYFSNHPLEVIIRMVVEVLRKWDVDNARRVDNFVGISHFIGKRIERAYNRDASVVYPPVDTSWLTPRKEGELGRGFLSVNALVPYKNIHLIVEAFNILGLELTIVGTGPEEKRLKNMALSNISFVGNVSRDMLARLYQQSKALIFASIEDFGIAPVEMLASGRPVIAFAGGGVLETVIDGLTGVYYYDLTRAAIVSAVRDFIERESDFSPDACIEQSRKFSARRFKDEFTAVVAKEIARSTLKDGMLTQMTVTEGANK